MPAQYLYNTDIYWV